MHLLPATVLPCEANQKEIEMKIEADGLIRALFFPPASAHPRPR